MWKENFQKYKLDLGKVEEQEIQLPTSAGLKKKKGNFKKKKKKTTSASLTMLKPGLCGSQQTVKNSSRDGNTRSLHISPKKLVCRSRSKLEPDMEQWTGSKLGKDCIKPVYCHLAYLSYMQSTS